MAYNSTAMSGPTVRDAWDAAMAACDQADIAPTYAEAVEKIGFAKMLLRGIRTSMNGRQFCAWNAPFPPQEPPNAL
jgi:hypothetical protein